jgi:hypothetical protein
MPYAVRDPQGHILSLHRHDPGVGEPVHADDPDVRRFLGLTDAGGVPAGEDAEFERLDAEFIRVLEDVIDALLSRNVLTITDLPDVAQSKLFDRKSFRERRPSNALDLLQPVDFGTL